MTCRNYSSKIILKTLIAGWMFFAFACSQGFETQTISMKSGGSNSQGQTGNTDNGAGTGQVDIPASDVVQPGVEPGQIPVNADSQPLWEKVSADGKQWTAQVMTELETSGKDLLDVIPADGTLFCDRYNQLTSQERKIFWTFFISAMVRFESRFDTMSKYQEAFNDNSGRPVISRGLLQISIESSKSYGCGFTNENQLHDPLRNLACGIKILNRWMKTDARIAGKVNNKWQGGARYWSVLREGDKESYKSILAWSRNLKMCK